MARMLFKAIGMLALIPLLIAGCATVEKTTKTSYTEKEILNPTLPVSTPGEYVALYEDYRVPVAKDVHGVEAGRKAALRRAVKGLKKKAFLDAAGDISGSLSQPIPPGELKAMAEKASRQYPEFLTDWKIVKQEVQKVTSGNPYGEMVITVYFKIDREALKNALVSSTETKDLAFEEKEIMSFTAPASTPAIYVATFNDYRMDVAENIKDRNEARKETVQRMVGALKMKAFKEASEDVYHALAQPMEREEFARAVEKAGKDYANFIMDWKITKQVVETRGPLSVQPETVKLSAYFRIDKKLLRKALVRERAITPVAKYRTYVELFWNVSGKDIHPEVVQSVLSTTEDVFAQKGYEVIQFEQIKGNLVQLLKKKGKKTDDVFSEDELTRFKANLELRNIDRKFVNGKRILADYADLLIGVTIKSVERRNGMVNVRLATDATLFERGKWVTLAHAEQKASIPYVQGSTDILTEVSRRAVRMMTAKLEPKVRKKLALRKAVEDVAEGEVREFVLVFKNQGRATFAKIKRRLMNGSRWEFKTADFQAHAIHLGYRGSIDSLAERVETYLEGADLSAGVGEYATSGNRILFGE